MSATDVVSVEVPDIGDFDDVPVIEILVSPGDTVETDDPLLTLESDKATMDVPAPFPGTIKEIQVSIGDRVSQGKVLLTMEQAGSAAGQSEASAAASDGAKSGIFAATGIVTSSICMPSRMPSSTISTWGPMSVRARHAQYVLADEGQDEIGRDRGHLIEPRLAELALDVELLGEGEAAVGLDAGFRRRP